MGNIVNKKVCKTLEFDKIIKMLTEEADSPLGRESASHLRPLSNKSEIIALQAETTHALTRIFHHGALSFHGLTDIRPSSKEELGLCFSIFFKTFFSSKLA